MRKIILVFLIIMITVIPSTIFATYGGIDTELQVGNTAAAQTSVGMTERIVGTLQVAGTIISVISLIIIGMRYMLSSVKERAQIKGVLTYWIIGAVLVLCTSNVLAVVYDVVQDAQHVWEDVPESEGGIKLAPTCSRPGIQLKKCFHCGRISEICLRSRSYEAQRRAAQSGGWKHRVRCSAGGILRRCGRIDPQGRPDCRWLLRHHTGPYCCSDCCIEGNSSCSRHEEKLHLCIFLYPQRIFLQ